MCSNHTEVTQPPNQHLAIMLALDGVNVSQVDVDSTPE